MRMTRRSLGLLLLAVGGALVAAPTVGRLMAQEAPNRRDFTIVAKELLLADAD